MAAQGRDLPPGFRVPKPSSVIKRSGYDQRAVGREVGARHQDFVTAEDDDLASRPGAFQEYARSIIEEVTMRAPSGENDGGPHLASCGRGARLDLHARSSRPRCRAAQSPEAATTRVPSGENDALCTVFSWPRSTAISCLVVASQSRAVQRPEAVTNGQPSGENGGSATWSSWPRSAAIPCPVVASQSRAVRSRRR